MLLNTIYNKNYITDVFKNLSGVGENKKNNFYEPATDTYVKVDKQQAFLKCWQKYFQELMPLYKDKKKGIILTHLIFGNEIANIETTLYSNALYFRVSIKGLYKKIDFNKNKIEEYEKTN